MLFKKNFLAGITIIVSLVSSNLRSNREHKEDKTMSENTEPKTDQREEAQEEQASSEQEQKGTEEQKERTETENLFHRLYLFGLGLQKDIEDTVKNLIERGEIEAEEKEKIVDDFVQKAKESSTKLENKIEELINQTIESMNLVPKEKYDSLEKRVQILESKVLELEHIIKELHLE
jgi:polyhydroxyalkanoate synthesis regulator phasin